VMVLPRVQRPGLPPTASKVVASLLGAWAVPRGLTGIGPPGFNPWMMAHHR